MGWTPVQKLLVLDAGSNVAMIGQAPWLRIWRLSSYHFPYRNSKALCHSGLGRACAMVYNLNTVTSKSPFTQWSVPKVLGPHVWTWPQSRTAGSGSPGGSSRPCAQGSHGLALSPVSGKRFSYLNQAWLPGRKAGYGGSAVHWEGLCLASKSLGISISFSMEWQFFNSNLWAVWKAQIGKCQKTLWNQ